MATDYSIRIGISQSITGLNGIAEVVRKVLETLSQETIALAYNADRFAGGRANVELSIAEAVSPTHCVWVLVDSSVSADSKARMLQRVLDVLGDETLGLFTWHTHSKSTGAPPPYSEAFCNVELTIT